MAYRPYKKNANGTLTDIPLYADMADKDGNGSNIAGTYQKIIYDLVIKTQAEFDAFVTNIKKSTFSSKNILLVGDGGTTAFTYNGIGIDLTSKVRRIDGISNAKISATLDCTTGKTALFYYSSIPTGKGYGISGLQIEGVNLDSDASIYAFRNCINISNCYVYLSGTKGSCFNHCDYIYNCYAEIHVSGNMSAFTSFSDCNYLVSCEAKCIGTNYASPSSFDYCSYLVNCVGYCSSVSYSAYGFNWCKVLVNCTSSSVSTSSSAYGYNSCSYASNCRVGTDGVTSSITKGTMTKWDTDSCDS